MRSRRGVGFQFVNKKYLLISTTVVLLFIIGTYFYYYSDSQSLKKGRTADLHIVALFKAEQVSHWYDERKANAVFYTTSPFSVDIYAKYANEGSTKALAQINQRNRLIEGLYGFERVFSVDLKRKEIVEDGSNKAIMPSIIIKYIDSALIFRKIYTTNFYLTEPGRQPQNAIIAPVINNQHEVLAVMVFYINPNKYLHTVKETIPLLYKTAQFFLVSPMADSAISLPFSKERLSNQIEFSFIHSDVAKSILKERTVNEDRNTNGKRIVSIIEPVPNLPWYVINSIERSELFAEVNFRTLIFGILLFIAVFGFLISLYFLILEQKARHELMLKTSEQERYFNNSIDMLCIADTDGYFRLLNPEWGRVLGYSISELEGRKFLDFVHPEDVERTVENATKLANNQIVTRFENRYQHKDGSYRWIEWRSYPFEKLIYASARDITARKFAEEEVRKTELWLRDSQRNSHIGSFNYDIVNDIWKSSEELDTIFGISADYDKTSTGWLKLIHPEHQKEMTEHLMDHVIRQHNNFDKEYRIIRQNDDEVRWVHGLGNLVFSKEGVLELMIGTIQDINDKKKTELALLKEERKYRLLFENMTSGFALHEMIYDDIGNPLDYRYIELNPAFERLTGVSANALIGHTVKEVLPNIEEHWINTFGNVAKTGEPIFYMNYAHELGKYYDTYAFSPEKDKFAVMFNDVTNRVKAENLLRESEAILKATMKSMNDGVLVVSSNGTITHSNPRFSQIFSIPAELFLSKNNTVILSYVKQQLSNPDEFEKQVVEIYQSDKSSEDILRFKDGRIIERFSYPLTSELPLQGRVWLFRDITERQKTEELIAYERNMLRILIDNINDFVYIKDTESRFLIANNALARTLNITVEEMLGKTDLELFPHDIATDFYNDEKNLFATGMPIINKEEKIIDLQGNDILFQTNKLPLRDASGSIIGLVGSGHVITEQKKYEEALQKRVLALTKPLNDPEEIEFTDLFNLDELQKIQDTFADATGVASIITSPDGIPITNASNFCKLCSIIRSTAIGNINCNRSDAYLGKQTYNGPTIKPCLSGGLWDASASITVGGIHVANWLIGQVRNEAQSEKEMLKYADTIGIDREEFKKALNDVPSMPQEQFNRVANALFILANELSLKAYQNIQQARFISEQKQSEQQIKKLNEELEKKVEERTIRLQELNKELESFAYSISHDLRAPIRHVDGFVRLLYSNIETPTEMAKGYYEKINIASKRMSGMIDELLAFSRLGRKELTVSQVNLNNIINEIIEQAKPDISHRNILWEIKPLPTVAVDHNVIKIAFENLISNAIKYTSKKSEAIIEIGCAEETSEKVVVYIKDNGAGFDMVFADKLFGVFQRLHSPDEFEGTGIGLANVKQIINKHKGTVSAQSKVNEGATFYVTLPK